MSNMNSFQRGRITGMPGTKTTVTLYPQTLSARMRNSVIRMIENHTIEGGWASKSKRIAQALSRQHGLQCGSTNWNGLHILGLSAEAAPSVAEVVRADWTARLLGEPTYGNTYYKDQYEQAMVWIYNLHSDFHVTLHDDANRRKVIEILAEHTTQEMKDKTKQVADMLRGTEPIHLITFRE
jgi:hypothetical protein